MSVSALRDVSAEKRAKERAEAPTVKTEAQMRADEHAKEKEAKQEVPTSVWKRKFRPLPEAKAVDLFADVVGDAFILAIAGALIIYEYVKSRQNTDVNAIRITELNEQLKEEEKRISELEGLERRQQKRVEVLEEALEALRSPQTKKRSFTLS
jgi:optic atrophy 3 protein